MKHLPISAPSEHVIVCRVETICFFDTLKKILFPLRNSRSYAFTLSTKIKRNTMCFCCLTSAKYKMGQAIELNKYGASWSITKNKEHLKMDNKNTAERKRLRNTNSAELRHKCIGDPHKELVLMDVLNQNRVSKNGCGQKLQVTDKIPEISHSQHFETSTTSCTVSFQI